MLKKCKTGALREFLREYNRGVNDGLWSNQSTKLGLPRSGMMVVKPLTLTEMVTATVLGLKAAGLEAHLPNVLRPLDEQELIQKVKDALSALEGQENGVNDAAGGETMESDAGSNSDGESDLRPSFLAEKRYAEELRDEEVVEAMVKYELDCDKQYRRQLAKFYRDNRSQGFNVDFDFDCGCEGAFGLDEDGNVRHYAEGCDYDEFD
ncbi:hypothetical protein BYT27DRAFT_7210900 [Phlegmacium glaucopus]|nr:hypothetical protein BYT27DRAFT_7210900 [Phlegmacium glaucopus]